MTPLTFILAWLAAATLLSLLWAAACGPADLSDDDYWPSDERGGA